MIVTLFMVLVALFLGALIQVIEESKARREFPNYTFTKEEIEEMERSINQQELNKKDRFEEV